MNQDINNTFKVGFSSNSQTFVPSLKKVNSTINVKNQNIDNIVEAKVDSDSSTFASSFNKTNSSFNTNLETRDQSVKDLYYDEIVYYDGGDVNGYD